MLAKLAIAAGVLLALGLCWFVYNVFKIWHEDDPMDGYW